MFQNKLWAGCIQSTWVASERHRNYMLFEITLISFVSDLLVESEHVGDYVFFHTKINRGRINNSIVNDWIILPIFWALLSHGVFPFLEMHLSGSCCLGVTSCLSSFFSETLFIFLLYHTPSNYPPLVLIKNVSPMASLRLKLNALCGQSLPASVPLSLFFPFIIPHPLYHWFNLTLYGWPGVPADSAFRMIHNQGVSLVWLWWLCGGGGGWGSSSPCHVGRNRTASSGAGGELQLIPLLQEAQF